MCAGGPGSFASAGLTLTRIEPRPKGESRATRWARLRETPGPALQAQCDAHWSRTHCAGCAVCAFAATGSVHAARPRFRSIARSTQNEARRLLSALCAEVHGAKRLHNVWLVRAGVFASQGPVAAVCHGPAVGRWHTDATCRPEGANAYARQCTKSPARNKHAPGLLRKSRNELVSLRLHNARSIVIVVAAKRIRRIIHAAHPLNV